MISGSALAGMLAALTICFFTPVALLMWLMIRRRAKRMIYMLMFGVIARAGVLLFQTFFTFCLDNIDGYGSLPRAVGLSINGIVYSVVITFAMFTIMRILKNDGLTYNRAFTLSVGFSVPGVLMGTGLTYFAKITNALSINEGTIYDSYSEKEAQKMIDMISQSTFMSGIADGLLSIALIMLFAMCMVLVLYGMAKGMSDRMFSVVLVIVMVQRLATDFLQEYANDSAVCLASVVMTAISVYVLYRLLAIEKEIMIKPRSMLLKESQQEKTS